MENVLHSLTIVTVTFLKLFVNELLILDINRCSVTDTEGQSQKNIKTLKPVNIIWEQIS